jgi:hypothetical protein
MWGATLGCVLRAGNHRAQGAAGADPWRLHLDPGAIVGGLIIGIGEKIGEIYWGPLVGGGIESWLRLHDRADLPAVPAAGPVRRTHHRKDVSDAQEQTFSHRHVLSSMKSDSSRR